MYFSTIIATTLIAAASSTMASNPCPAHTYPKCCGVDVLGLADLDCTNPRDSLDTFTQTCATQGKEPKCCAIPVGGQALFCVHPNGSPGPSPAPNNQVPLGGGTPSPASSNGNPVNGGDPGNGNPPNNGNPPGNGPSATMANSSPESGPLCPSLLYSNAQCCATDVLGVADLDCSTPNSAARSAKDFAGICAQTGKTAACCTLPLLGQGTLCVKPVGA